MADGRRRLACALRRVALYGRDEAISTAGQRLYIARTGGGVSQCLADFVDRGVQAVVEIDECIRRPKLLLQLFSRDYFARALQQQGEYLKGLTLQAQLHSILAEFTGAEVKFENAKASDSAVVLRHDAVV